MRKKTLSIKREMFLLSLLFLVLVSLLFAGNFLMMLGRKGYGEYAWHADPNIMLAAVGQGNLSVKVEYSALEGQTAPVTKTFFSLSDAAADDNAQKNANHILDPVKVSVEQTGANAVMLTHKNTKDPSSSVPPEEPDSPSNPPTTPNIPKTGDPSIPVYFYVIAAAVSILAAIIFTWKSKK